jgi:hypothetical protein
MNKEGIQKKSIKELKRLSVIAAKEFGEKTSNGFIKEKGHPCFMYKKIVNHWYEEKGKYRYMICPNCNWTQVGMK